MAAAARPNHLLCSPIQASFDAMTCRAFVLGVETDAKMFYAVDGATTADLTGPCGDGKVLYRAGASTGLAAPVPMRGALLASKFFAARVQSPGAACPLGGLDPVRDQVAPRPRIRRSRSAGGCPGLGFRAACACLLLSCDPRASARVRRGMKSGFCVDNRRVRAPNIVGDRCPATPPMPVAAPAPHQPTEQAAT